jgi:hypothetical protein
VGELDGVWRVEPLPGVTKRIRGERGETRLWRLPGVPFRVRGLDLVYPGGVLVDRCAPDDCGGYRLDATLLGRTWGRFRLRRLGP